MTDSAEKELWVPVAGFPCGHYEVNQFCRVRSVVRRGVRKERLLRATINDHGYPQVNLLFYGKTFTRRVHRLVAEAFLGPCPIGQEVRHLILGSPLSGRALARQYGVSPSTIYAIRCGVNWKHLRSNSGGDLLTDPCPIEEIYRVTYTAEAT
jgi:hypothetical protein